MVNNVIQKGKHQKLLMLFVPIFIETFLLMLCGMVDTFMVSRISDKAVGAIGTANAYYSMLFLVFAVISNGLLSVMSQYIGAGKKGVAFQARQLAIIFNFALGLIFSLFLGFGAKWLVNVLGVSEALKRDAAIYLRIVGVACIIDALIPVFSNYLRAFDKTKYTLYAALAGNAVNLLLDGLFLFVFNWGVMGVAIATVIGKVTILTLCLLFGHYLIHGLQFKERESRKLVISQILRVGLPSAIEAAGYSLSIAAVITLLNRMDPNGFNANARSYAYQISTFSFAIAFALAQANVILCGWQIGEGREKDCYSSTFKAATLSIASCILVGLTLALASFGYLRVLTKDSNLARIITILLFMDIGVEIGRAANLVYDNTLKSTGDSLFPMYVSVPMTLVLTIGGTYLFGFVLNMGVIGAYIGLITDEISRGIIMFIRWRSGKWEKKVIIKRQLKVSKEATRAS